MTDFGTVLGCALIPVVVVLAYIAGKNDLLQSIGEMLENWAEDLEKEKQMRMIGEIPYLQDTRELRDKAYNQGYLSGLDFSVFMHYLLISRDGYVIDTGNYENVNAEVALRLYERIKSNPQLWKLFMVA